MKSDVLIRSIAFAACCIATGAAAAEDDLMPTEVGFVEDTGAAIRIEAGDELRVVSQEVPAAVCHLHNGVASELSAELIIEGVEKFDRMMNALLNGDTELGIIGGEERGRTIRLLVELQTSWDELREAALAVHEDPTNTDAVALVYTMATPMLEETSRMLSDLEAQYANPVELLYADAMLLEVAGRQAMLTQRLSYLACRKWSGSSDANYIEMLKTAAAQYDFAMNAMMNGAPDLGISPPPGQEIADALQAVSADSGLIKQKISSLIGTGVLDADRAEALYVILADKMHKMEKIAHLYALNSRRVY